MNICMFTSEFPPDLGGRSTYVHNLSKGLIEHGHNVTIIARGGWKRTYREEIDGISVYRVRYIPFYPSPFYLHGFFLNKLFKKLESHFDLVHVHGALMPVVHTSLPVIFTSHGTIRKDIDNMPAKSFHFLVVKLLRKQLINLEKKIVENADVITVVSHSCAKDLKGDHTISKEIIVVNNGVHTNFFIPLKNDKKEEYILYTGRLETRKGLVDFIESAEYVCQEHADIKFILTGKGTIKKYLERRIAELGLKNNFYFAGFVNRSNLLKYYQDAEIYVLPSYYEGLPTTLLEAMSCGIPSIATDVEGNSELIKDGETGLLVPPRDPKRLAEAILRLLDDKELRKKLGDNARKYVVNNYNWDIITNNIDEIYGTAMTKEDSE